MSDAPPSAPSDSPPSTILPDGREADNRRHSATRDRVAAGDGDTKTRRKRGRRRHPQHAAPPTKGQRAARSAIEWVAIVAAALIVAFVVKTFLIQAFSIPSASMEPRLTNGDRVFVNKLSYRLHDVNRGDVVVFERPACDTGSDTDHLIKRVIAREGETVEARGGRLFIDGRALDEPYLPAGVETEDFVRVEVPPDSLWVMGDNRGNSKDSRFLCNGTATFIPEDALVGRAFVRVWPLGDLTLL